MARFIIGMIGSGVVGGILGMIHKDYEILSLMIFAIWTFIVYCLGEANGRNVQ